MHPSTSSQFKGFGTGFARRGDQKALTWEDDPPGKFKFYNLQYNTILDILHVSLSYTNEKSGYFMPTSYLYTQALFFFFFYEIKLLITCIYYKIF